MCVSDADCGSGSLCKADPRAVNIQVAGDDQTDCSEHCEDAVSTRVIVMMVVLGLLVVDTFDIISFSLTFQHSTLDCLNLYPIHNVHFHQSQKYLQR